MKDKTKKNPFAPVIYFFSRYNLLIFVTIIVAGLSVSVLILASILQVPYDETSYGSSDSVVTFDESTINRINQLSTSEQNTTSSSGLSGRANLFAE